MLWPFVQPRERSARTLARRSCPRPAGQRRRLGTAVAAERLEPRRLLAADITLVGGVLTVAFDDTSDDVVSLSITATGYEATGANVTSGTGTISQLVVTDAGTVKTSSLTLLQADQTLTGGLSIAANVTTVSINASVTTVGNVSVTARNIVITANLVSTSGDISLVGDAGATVAGAFHGVHLNGSGVEVKTLATDLVAGATGAITVQGRGGDAQAAGLGKNRAYGVYLQAGASISAGGSGDVSVTGVGGVSTFASFNSGVLVSNSDAANGVSEIVTAGGNITVIGTAGGASGVGDNYGVSVNSFGRIAAGGSGSVSLTGTATETGGMGNAGVIVTNFIAASQVTPTAAITSAGGGITITGTGTAAGAAVILRNEGKVISGGTGTVTIVADSLLFDTELTTIDPTSITAGAAGDATVTIRPRTAGTLIDIGGPNVLSGSPLTLGLTTAEIDRITAGTLAIGDAATTGAVTVSEELAPRNEANVTITSAAGISLAADVVAGEVAFDGPVTLAADVGVVGTGAVTFTGTVDGTAGEGLPGSRLSVNASGDLEFQGVIGGLVPLAELEAQSIGGNLSLAGVGGAAAGVSGDTQFTAAGDDGTIRFTTAGLPTAYAFGGNLVATGKAIRVEAAAAIAAAGDLVLSAEGLAGAGAGIIIDRPVAADDMTSIRVTGTSNILLSGRGGQTSGSANDGVVIGGAGDPADAGQVLVESESGFLVISGFGGTDDAPGSGPSTESAGLSIRGGTVRTSVGGSIQLTGFGSASGGMVGTAERDGVVLEQASILTDTTLDATGRIGISGSGQGVGGGIKASEVLIRSGSGGVSIFGSGAGGSGSAVVLGGVVDAIGGGINISGSGSADGGSGILLAGSSGTPVTIGSATTGTIGISGVGGGSAGESDGAALEHVNILGTGSLFISGSGRGDGTGLRLIGSDVSVGDLIFMSGSNSGPGVGLDLFDSSLVAGGDLFGSGASSGGGDGIRLGGTVGIQAAGDAFLSGQAVLAAATQAAVESSAGNVQLTGPITGGADSALAVKADTGTVAVLLAVDGGLALTATAAGSVSLPALGTTAPLASLSVGGAEVSLVGGVVTAGGAITIDDGAGGDTAVVLQSSMAIDATSGGDVPAGAAITIRGTVTSDTVSRFLQVKAGTDGDVLVTDTIGAVGAGVALSALTISGNDITLASVTATTVTIADTTGTVTFQGPLTAETLLTASEPYAVAILGDGSEIVNQVEFANTGGVTLGGAGTTLTFTGGVTSTAGATTLAGTLVTTDADASFGAVTLAADTTIIAGSGNVSFGGTVTGPGALAVTAAAITVTNGLGQAVNRLASLTLTGDTMLAGDVFTAGDQTYDGNLVLSGFVRMNTTFPTPATVRFTGLVDGDGFGSADRLEFNLFDGSLVMESAVGSQDPLASVTVESAASVTLGGDVTTTGLQRYNAASLALNGTYTTTDAEFSTAFSPATVTTLTGDTTITTGSGNISLGNVAGDVADTRSLLLTTTGQSSLVGPGGTGRLASLTVTGGEARVGGMATSGAQSYGGDLRATNPSPLGNPVFSTAAGGLGVAGATILAANGTVSFDIQGGPLAFTGPIDNNDNPVPVSNLAINATGDVLFGAAVGADKPPLNLSVTTPGTLTLSGNVTTWPGTGPWGVQTYAAKVVLAADATLKGLSVSFSEGLDGGGHNLVLDAASAAIAGGFANLASLVSPGSTALSGNVATSGGQLYGGLALGGDATLTAGGNVTFTGSVNGAHALDVANAANVNFGGNVGQTTPLADLTVAAPGGGIEAFGRTITAGGVAFHSANQTVAAIETTGAVNGSLGTGNLTLDATDSLLAFGNLTASRNLATGAGNAFFAVGGDLIGVRANNGSVTVGGNATIGGLEGTLLVNATGGNITFGGALNECGTTAAFLNTSGDILFRGAVRDLDLLLILGGASVTAEAAVSGVGIFGQIGGTGTTTLADVATIMGQIYQTGTVHLTGANYSTSGGEFTIEGAAMIGTAAAEELVTIATAGGNVTISGGSDGIYAARPEIVPSLVGPAGIIGSGTSLAIDAGSGNVTIGGMAGFSSGGLAGLPLLNVTLAGDRILLPAVTSNLIGGTLAVTEGTLTGSGTVGSLAFDPATTLLVSVGDLTPVTGYGQFTVDSFGTVDLGSAALDVSAGFPVPVGTILTIIDNQGSAPVSGTFAGLPEGATVVGSSGIFKVSYVGGDGNDVTLEAVDGDIVVSVVDNRVVITLAPTGTTVTNLSTRYVPRTGRLVITVAADRTLTGGGTGVTVNDAAGTVTVNLAQLPGFAGFDVIGSAVSDVITVGPGGINLAAVTRGAVSQSVAIAVGGGTGGTVTIAQPVRTKGTGAFSVAAVAGDSSAGIRLGTTITTPRGPQAYLGDVTLVGPTTVAGGGMLFTGGVDGPHRLTVNATGQAVFTADVGSATPLAGMTIQRAGGVVVLGGFRLDGTGLGSRASGLVIGRNVKEVAFAALAGLGEPPARSITGFGGSGILFQGGSTGSTIRHFALIGNGRGITFQPGNYAGTRVAANTIAGSSQIGVVLSSARGLVLGGTAAGDGNAITSASAERAYATGIFAQGNLAGTRVVGNTIESNTGNGVVMNAARGIRIGGDVGNTITANGGWGLVASGVSTGSVVAGNTISGNAFGQVNVRRARGLRVLS